MPKAVKYMANNTKFIMSNVARSGRALRRLAAELGRYLNHGKSCRSRGTGSPIFSCSHSLSARSALSFASLSLASLTCTYSFVNSADSSSVHVAKKDAEEKLVERIIREELTTELFLERHLANYPYGLDLIRQKTGEKEFELPIEVIQNPNGTLDQWIKEKYEK